MKILLLNVDRSSTLSLDELLLVWPDRYKLLIAVVIRGAMPSLAGQIAQRDPEAGREFIKRVDKILGLEQCTVRRAKNELYHELYLSQVRSALARTKAQEILGEIDE